MFLEINQNAFYLGDGQFNFTDVSDIAGITSPNSWSTGVSVLDINNDGLLDLYVCKSGMPNDVNRRNELFINIGIKTAYLDFLSKLKILG